jgi:filamentous hemagglutinin
VKSPLHPALRLLTLFLTGVLFLSSGSVLLAQSARSVMSPAGGGAGGGRASAANLQNAGAASASLTASRAREAMQKSESALSAMRALQKNARSLMVANEAPNGLAEEGLHPLDGFKEDGTPDTKSWSGARITSAKDSANVVIKQGVQNAFLYWNKFNVGSKTTVRFDQSKGGADAGKWIAFNKVMGSESPSQIRGSILAEGQVYILNQNGIIFHNGSQVNTRGLVASTLPINENLAGDALKGIKGRGIANNPDSQFLFSALEVAGNANKKTDSFVPSVSGSIGDVVVERGASIISPANANNTGGMVALIGANVRNEGAISTPNGQTILAAGLQVGLTPHPSSDPTLRGMDVAVGKVSDGSVSTLSESSGEARNSGILSAMQGNVTMAGKTLRQNGVIESSTETDLNGRIDLSAVFNASMNPAFGTQGDPIIYDPEENTGLVELGRGSLMRILPEQGSGKKITGTSLALNSVVSITGRNVHLGEDAVVLAPGAASTAGALSQAGSKLATGITVAAGKWADPLESGEPSFVKTSGRIQMESGSMINAAGTTGVTVDSGRHFLKLQLRGSELADSPLQRNGTIRGEDLMVDARQGGTYNGRQWIGTPLGNASGYAGLIERTASELTTRGGSVTLDAGDAVVVNRGSVIDVSGGWVNYTGGHFSTSKLMYQGNLIDISQATPDRVYSGLVTGGDKTILGKTYKDAGAATMEVSSKWGVAKVFKSPLDPTRKQYEAPYVSGADGGSITIQAPSVALDGSLLGQTIAGPRQVRSTPLVSTLAGNSAFTLSLASQSLINGGYVTVSPYAPKVTFSGNRSSDPVGEFILDESGAAEQLPEERRNSATLSPDLLGKEGFGSLTVLNHDGSITVPSGVVLNAGVGGSVRLEGANIDVGGRILAPSGNIDLSASLTPYSLAYVIRPAPQNVSYSDILEIKETGEKVIQYGPADGDSVSFIRADGSEDSLPVDAVKSLSAGRVTIRSGSVVSAAGLISDDSTAAAGRFTTPITPRGGEIKIAGYRVDLAQGSLLDVSGGAHVAIVGNPVYGDAGSLSLSAGRDSVYPEIHDGSLALGGKLAGFAGAERLGGGLSITAPAFQIGTSKMSVAPPVSDEEPAPVLKENRVTRLDPAFFNEGGFSRFSLSGVGLALPQDGAYVPGVLVASGTSIQPKVRSQILKHDKSGFFLQELELPPLFRPAPSVTLEATGLVNPALEGVNKAMVIRGDLVIAPGSSIALDPQMLIQEGVAGARSGSLVLKGATVFVGGTLSVPGGEITISGAGALPSNDPAPTDPFVTVNLSPTASLSTAGGALYARDPRNGMRDRFGTVLAGGSIRVSGNILAEKGAAMDVSGASGVYDFFPDQLGKPRIGSARNALSPSTLELRLDSPGGSIALSGGEALLSDASLVARSGGSSASGGSLSVSSGRFYAVGEEKFPTDINLSVGATGPTIPEDFEKTGPSAIGMAMSAAKEISGGGGQIAVSSFEKGGFSHLTLGGNVLFNESLSITLPGSIRAASGGILSTASDASVDLKAEYVALGRAFVSPLAPDAQERISVFDPANLVYYAPPTSGTGRLTVQASVIDLGNLSLRNIGKARLDANGGVIRGNGTFAMAGDLILKAAQIYPVTGATFTAVAFNHDDSGTVVSTEGTPGSIVIEHGGFSSLPLSAVGSLALYADSIIHSGTLVAPFGTITLGNLGEGQSSPVDPVSGLAAPITSSLKLTGGSITSVSGVDPITGSAITVPYGTSTDGSSWKDPSGTMITSTGIPEKKVILNGGNVEMQAGSLVNLSGGGKLTAGQFVRGLGGTIDWLSDSLGSYAIIPGFDSPMAPKGYGEEAIPVGTRVTLAGGAGLPAGTYTLLPASYAKQPGAFLLTPSARPRPSSSQVQPDGSELVMGFMFNGLDSSVKAGGLPALFELSSPGVISGKVDYRILDSDHFFASSPSSSRSIDGARLIVQSTAGMILKGSVSGQAAGSGKGAMIDISSSRDFLISANQDADIPENTILLDPTAISSWNAGSLLIGGIRRQNDGKVSLAPATQKITLESGASLAGTEVILAAAPRTHTVKNVRDETPKDPSDDVIEDLPAIADAHAVSVEDLMQANGLTEDSVLKVGQVLKIPGSVAEIVLQEGSSVTATGSEMSSPLTVIGNGAFLRASGDSKAITRRSGYDANATDLDGRPLGSLSVGGESVISGASLVLDSSSITAIDPTASLKAGAVKLGAGRIEVNGDNAEALNLSGSLLSSLSTLKSLSLSSYTTLKFNQGAELGSESLDDLQIHAAGIVGDNSGGNRIKAASILLDNEGGARLTEDSMVETAEGALEIKADSLRLGSGSVRIDGFKTVGMTLSAGLQSSGNGGLMTAGDLSITTPVLTAVAGSSTKIGASGNLAIASSGPDPGKMSSGLGASMSLQGGSVSVSAPVSLPSGIMSISATTGDLSITSLLNVGGVEKKYYDVTKYTDAGTVRLSAASGNINLSQSTINLSARDGGGNAGNLGVFAPKGTVALDGAILASARNGEGGGFVADLGSFNAGVLDPLMSKISSFTKSQNIRLRTGNAFLNSTKTGDFTLSADLGDITVSGVVNASGKTGGTIGLFAGRSVILESGSVLNVHGETLDAAGKGGLINLEAGSLQSALSTSAGRVSPGGAFASGEPVIDLKGGRLELGVGNNQEAGTVMLKAPQTADASDLRINPIFSTIERAESVIAVGNNRIDAATPGVFSIDSPAEWSEGVAYQAGQSVLYNNAVYRLGLLEGADYADYVANNRALTPDDSSGPWVRTAVSWDEVVISGYSRGDKVYSGGLTYTATRDNKAWNSTTEYAAGDTVFYDGKTYAANAGVPSDSAAPDDPSSLWTEVETKSPGSPGSSGLWEVKLDDGNLQQIALENAKSFTEKVSKSFAGATLEGKIQLHPGEELVNSVGGLLLNNDWDLSRARYGELLTVLDAQGEVVTQDGITQRIGRDPGLLTFRAKGDIIFNGSLSDGFGDSVNPAAEVIAADGVPHGLYFAPLLPLLKNGVGQNLRQQSWSYRIIAGSDPNAAHYSSLMEGEGARLTIGRPGDPIDFSEPGPNAMQQDMINKSGLYQVIRTGTGDISLASSGDIRLMNSFSSIYTAGSRVLDPTLGETFDNPIVYLQDQDEKLGAAQQGTVGSYPVQYAFGGGNISIRAGRDVTRLNALLDSDKLFQYDESGELILTAESSRQMPSNWLYRRGSVDPNTGLFEKMSIDGQENNDVASTTWWVDYSNFFQGVGALGGGDILVDAGRDVVNVDAVIPTTFRMPGKDSEGNPIAPSVNGSVELGGGNLSVNAGRNIDAGVYYVERGSGLLKAGGGIITNPTRDTQAPWITKMDASATEAYLPTSLFLGKGSFSVKASGDLLLGPVANVFLTPQGINNSYWYKTYFSTFAPDTSVVAESLAGNLTLRQSAALQLSPAPLPLLRLWFEGMTGADNSGAVSFYQPWVRTAELRINSQDALVSLMPPTLSATALSGDITLQGNLTMAPAPSGNLSLIAGGGVTGLASAGAVTREGIGTGQVWSSATVNLSDADPLRVPRIISPVSKRSTLAEESKDSGFENANTEGAFYFTDTISSLFAESGSYYGSRADIVVKSTLHDTTLLHAGDTEPLRILASGSGISGLTLFSGKKAVISASTDITDIALYIQNVSASDISTVSAGGSIKAYDTQSLLRGRAEEVARLLSDPQYVQNGFPSGDIQISGPGTLELLAGGNVDLGNAPAYDGDPTVWNGISSIGNARNPGLPFQGADILVSAGLKLPAGLASEGVLRLQEFSTKILSGEDGAYYMAELANSLTYSGSLLAKGLSIESLSPESTIFTREEKALLQLQLFSLVLRETGRNYNKEGSPGYRKYTAAREALATIFGNVPAAGSVITWSRDIRTKSGGNISILAPGGGLTLASIAANEGLTPPGIVTESGGGINIFAENNVDIGIGRIFTLRGGDVMIWSDKGNIAAGSSAKTVASAPPTRVLIDPQSGAVQTDLAGLATGGGIGVLATVKGVPPGNVDLIAPEGVIDAGDAGIRSTGNLNLAATRILNANNIAAGGTTSGAPPAPPPPSAPNVSGATAASAASAGNNASAQAATKPPSDQPKDEAPSVISVEVLGYGGGDAPAEEEPKKSAGGSLMSPPQASL